MSIVNTDIDIDFADRMAALSGLPYVSACLTNHRGQRQRHPSGVYFQNIPVDPLSEMSAYEYTEAADLGYFKVDFLNNSLYEGVRDEAHLVELLNREPDWSLFEHEHIVEMLAHLSGNFGVVHFIRPKSIEDVALVLALMRPGKRYLLSRSREEINASIWQPDETGFSFKKAHAIAYAASIVVQLNLICEAIGSEIDHAV